MKVNFNLTRPMDNTSHIRIVISHRGKSFRQSCGISCRTKDWSKVKQRCSNAAIQNRLREIREWLESVLDEQSTDADILRALADVKDKSRGVSSDKEQDTLFWACFSNVDGFSPSAKKLRLNACKKFRSLSPPGLDWDDINSQYFTSTIKLMRKSGLSANTMAAYVGELKSVMKEGYKLKYHNNLDFMDFHVKKEIPDTVYLTEDELASLWAVQPDSEVERKARDLFLLGVYTAARYSDCSMFSKRNIYKDKFRYTQKKTGQSVIMPLSPKVEALLQRNEWMAPHISLPVYDRTIKRVARKAGIDAEIEITKTVGGRHVTLRLPKYEFIGSHTARRTGCTLLYKSGVPLKVCMYLSGHTSESNFLRYIRITKEEGADMLAKLDFFK